MGKSAAFSPDGTYLAIAHTTTPYVTIYKHTTGDTFEKIADPATLPKGDARGAAFSPDGTYLAIAHGGSSPYVTIYKHTTGDTFEKVADPTGGSPIMGYGVAFSPDSTYLGLGNSATPPIVIYKHTTGDAFEKVADPADLPPNDVFGVAFSGIYLATAHDSTPYVTIYKHTTGDTFEKVADPTGGLPATGGYGDAFSPDGTYLAIAHIASPYVTIYKHTTGDAFEKVADPDVLPTGVGWGAAFSPDSTYLAIAHTSSPYVTIYKYVAISVTSANNGGGGTTLVINKSPEVITGDVMVANISVRGGTGTTITPPADWNLVRRTNSTTVLAHATYWKAATGSESSSYTWTITSNKASGGIQGFRGIDPTNPIDDENGQSNASSANIVAPTITTTVDNTILVFGGGTAVGTTVSSYPSGLAKRYEDASTGGSAATRTTTTGGDEPKATQGSTGTRTVTMAAAAVNIGHLLALKPCGAAGKLKFNVGSTARISGTALVQ
jgi:WD40 repeat protein